MTSTSGPSSTSAERVVADTFRAEWGRLLSSLVARTRRLDLAEDALSEAFARASERWLADGIPGSPAGWIYTTAWRLIVGRLRAEAVAGRHVPLLAIGRDWVLPTNPEELSTLDDERLQLILLCCHPALHPDARCALALRLVIGTPTEEIARLFLVPTATVAARITRAKKKIVAAGIPLASPIHEELRVRLDEVCRTIYLAFTAGYTPGRGEQLLRADLAGDAVQLANVLHRVAPSTPSVRALYALVLLQHARRDARQIDGRLVTLADQDRSLWHHDELQTGLQLLHHVRPSEGYAEELRLQACIAGEHARASSAAATDWTAIAALYADLEALTGSPIVRLNRAVAVAEADGPRSGLAVLDGLEDVLSTNHRLFAVRAELARRAGLADLARTSYAEAIDLCDNATERSYLVARANDFTPNR